MNTLVSCRGIGRGKTKDPGSGPEVDRVSHAGALWLLVVTCSSIPSSCSSHTSLHFPLISYPVLWTYSSDGPGRLSSSCRPASRPMFPGPGTHLLPPPSHPLLASTAPTAFKSHIKHCEFVKAFLIILTTLCLLWLSSALFFLYTDVQYYNQAVYISVSVISTRNESKDCLFSYMYPS